jgi:GFO/IDH/MocA oxidoreductase family protein
MNIGYVGLDNSHAEQLMKMVNVDRPDGLPEARFTHMWGNDPDRAKELQETCQTPTICASPEDLLGKVDTVIVGSRAGARHLAEARPFLEAGMTVYIDKPLANDLADAQAIVDLAETRGARVTSFSGLRVVPEVVKFKADYTSGEAELYGGAVNGHGDKTNPYGGWYFYAVHSIELLLDVWSPTGGDVLAAEIGDQMHIRVACDSGEIVTLQLSPKFPPFSLAGYIDHNTTLTVVPLGAMQIEVTKRVLDFLGGAEDLTPRQLVAPLKVMEAVRQSLASGAPARFEV